MSCNHYTPQNISCGCYNGPNPPVIPPPVFVYGSNQLPAQAQKTTDKASGIDPASSPKVEASSVAQDQSDDIMLSHDKETTYRIIAESQWAYLIEIRSLYVMRDTYKKRKWWSKAKVLPPSLVCSWKFMKRRATESPTFGLLTLTMLLVGKDLEEYQGQLYVAKHEDRNHMVDLIVEWDRWDNFKADYPRSRGAAVAVVLREATYNCEDAATVTIPDLVITTPGEVDPAELKHSTGDRPSSNRSISKEADSAVVSRDFAYSNPRTHNDNSNTGGASTAVDQQSLLPVPPRADTKRKRRAATMVNQMERRKDERKRQRNKPRPS